MKTLASRVHFCRTINVQKACPIVTRATKHGLEVLAFRHTSAGNQFVKGTIQQGKQPRDVEAHWPRAATHPLAAATFNTPSRRLCSRPRQSTLE
jgi:hypothetical protein